MTVRARIIVNLMGGAVAAAAVASLVADVVRAGPTDFDDAYMFLRYARNLLAGGGLAWNAGEPTNGVTGLLHLGFVTALLAGAPSVADGRLLQVASTGAAVLALAGLAVIATLQARSRPLRGNAGVWAALVVAPLALDGAFVFHARTGMDTHAALLANTVVAAAALGLAARPTPTRALLGAGAAYLAYFARPDSVIYAIAVPALVTLERSARTPRSSRASAGPEGLGEGGRPHSNVPSGQAAGLPAEGRRAARPALPVLLLFLGAALALIGLDLALRRFLLGTALPLAFYAKRPGAYGGFVGEHTWNAVLFLRVFLMSAAPFLIVLVVFGDRRGLREAAAWLAPVAVTFAALFWPRQIMGHLGRFFFPALPFIVVPAARALDRFLDRAVPADATGAALAVVSLRGLVARSTAVAIAVPLIGFVLARAAAAFEAPAAAQPLARIDGLAPARAHPLPEIDSWRASQEIALLARAAPPASIFAMSEHGLVAASAPHVKIIDVLGLHDRVFALSRFNAAELWSRRPDLLWLPHPDHTQMLHDILTSPTLARDYIFIPNAFTYGIALRRASPRFETLWRRVSERWSAVYSGLLLDDFVAARASAPIGDTLVP